MFCRKPCTHAHCDFVHKVICISCFLVLECRWILAQVHTSYFLWLPYTAKFSRVFNFANFVNFQPFAKLFQRKFFYTYTSVFTCIGVDGQHAAESTRNTLWRDNLRSKHCIADSYKFKCGQRCVTVRIRTCLYASPILLTCVACTWFRQQIREIIISSKTTIRENLALYGIYHGVLLVMV